MFDWGISATPGFTSWFKNLEGRIISYRLSLELLIKLA